MIFSPSRFKISLFLGILALTAFPALAAVSENLMPSAYVENFLKDYSTEEKESIEEDRENITRLCFRHQKPAEGRPVYVATAGAPGASKSTILETWLRTHPDFVYADPDPRALRLMTHTYLQSLTYYDISQASYDISQASPYQELLQSAYDKWRPASNYIACTILNSAFEKGFNIAHGTTSTAREVSGLYERLKKKGYKIILLLCGSTDQNRLNAGRHRAQTRFFIQSSDADVINKGKMFPERFPVYFHYADEIHFYWTEDFQKGSVEAASFDKTNGLRIENQQAYESFVSNYEQARQENKELAPFASFISGDS